jgi:gamma-glutamyl phosphate reductase
MADGLEARTDELLAANEKDLESFEKAKGSNAMAVNA